MFVLPLASTPLRYVRGVIATLACGVALSAGTACLADETEQFEFVPGHQAITAAQQIDRIYWLCDELMEYGPLDLEMSAVCSTVTEIVKKDRFEGDFEAYAAWWREQKLAQTEALNTP